MTKKIEPLRKKFAKFSQNTCVGTLMACTAIMGVPVISGFLTYGGLRYFEASEWDSQVIGDRDQTLENMQNRFKAMEYTQNTLDDMQDSRKVLYGQGIEVLHQATKEMQEQQSILHHQTTAYAKDLITSKSLDESDYYDLGQDFLDADFNHHSSIKPNANYFESSNRMECHLNVNKKSDNMNDAEYINECMEREASSGSDGFISTSSASFLGVVMFFILLGADTKLHEWKKLPNVSKRKLLPTPKKMKEN